MSRGYRQGGQPFQFFREVPFSDRDPITVEVDLLAGQYGGTSRSHRTQIVQDARARKTRGCDLVFENNEIVAIEGELPGGGHLTVQCRVAAFVPFLVMKGMALADRLKEKDAYDIYYCVRQYPGGIAALAEAFRPHIRNALVRRGKAFQKSSRSSLAPKMPVRSGSPTFSRSSTQRKEQFNNEQLTNRSLLSWTSSVFDRWQRTGMSRQSMSNEPLRDDIAQKGHVNSASHAMLTEYHAKYFAYELTKRCPSDSAEKLAGALVDAQVDLNPHQIEASLFAFRSPLSRGALLADEVGLGKTIEAGLVLSQKWAERKRRILVITPSNLRKQWYQELTEKFFLPCRILESRSYNIAIKQGQSRPFEGIDVVICSYQFAKSKAGDVSGVAWDLVVIDEAHRLRNVYKPSNVIANTLKAALVGKDKLLLTATPLQNSILELFGLVSFIDEHAFGDLKSFREQFSNLSQAQVFQTLKARLKPLCHRTLRRQVLPYVKFTARHPIVQRFTPEESEDRLYNLVSEYLQRDNLQALPASQRSLMTMVLRKLLASSTFAIAGALESLSNRLKLKMQRQEPAESLEEQFDQDYEALDETADEWTEDEPSTILSASR